MGAEYCARCDRRTVPENRIRISVTFYPGDGDEPRRPWRRDSTPWPSLVVCGECFKRVTAELAGAGPARALGPSPAPKSVEVSANPRERLKTLIRSALALTVEAEECGSHSV
jgi:hypothetical protein